MVEYFPIFIFFIFALALSLLLASISFLLASTANVDAEKLSAYECGFDPFDDARNRFDIRFYLVAILFIIFDLEVIYLFPWSVSLSDGSMIRFWSMMAFLILLTIGFIYEWMKGALDWH
uniref:NADH-ubiquinone oxidoreductase chain 3 n=1 Tax=Mesostigma viride TaxID=41882 RepID=Q8W9S5_MESVI|nr:NADH dehydrogenase subunit 3 [Mesostigma viride]AAL36729.1 NADH dehydrogenase subunit 3 [Mesostigma viride]ADU04621.1 NADH dehydrogenase subunit 3 [Mesostigma viride]